MQMKITIIALTAFVMATAPLAWAQEEGETPAPAPEMTAPETTAPEPWESPAIGPERIGHDRKTCASSA